MPDGPVVHLIKSHLISGRGFRHETAVFPGAANISRPRCTEVGGLPCSGASANVHHSDAGWCTPGCKFQK